MLPSRTSFLRRRRSHSVSSMIADSRVVSLLKSGNANHGDNPASEKGAEQVGHQSSGVNFLKFFLDFAIVGRRGGRQWRLRRRRATQPFHGVDQRRGRPRPMRRMASPTRRDRTNCRFLERKARAVRIFRRTWRGWSCRLYRPRYTPLNSLRIGGADEQLIISQPERS